ncbi:hypothetical protein Tco_0051434 [Tanacetum coccineum]
MLAHMNMVVYQMDVKMAFYAKKFMSANRTGLWIKTYKLKKALYGLKQAPRVCMESSDPVDTPMVEKSKLDEDTQGKAIDPTHYRGMIGTLMYLIASRPYLTFMYACVPESANPTRKAHS